MDATVALAADHAGFALKDALVELVRAAGLVPLDLGTHDATSVDYPDIADRLAAALASQGVLVCGTGIGIAIAANRHRHVRAAVCHDATTARLAREHNDANVLCLGARIVGGEVAADALRAFLATGFAGDRHARRVAKLG